MRACGTVFQLQINEDHAAGLRKLNEMERTLTCVEYLPSCSNCRRYERACKEHDILKLRSEWATAMLRECHCIVSDGHIKYEYVSKKMETLKEKLKQEKASCVCIWQWDVQTSSFTVTVEIEQNDEVCLVMSNSDISEPLANVNEKHPQTPRNVKILRFELMKLYQQCKDLAIQLFKAHDLYFDLSVYQCGHTPHMKHAESTKRLAQKLLKLADYDTEQDPEFKLVNNEAMHTRRQHCSCLGHCFNVKRQIGSIKQALLHFDGAES